jgi:hypothetical protein
MKTWMKVLLITLPVAILSLPLGQMIWPPASGGMDGEMAMSGLVLLGFIGVGIFEGLALGKQVPARSRGPPSPVSYGSWCRGGRTTACTGAWVTI